MIQKEFISACLVHMRLPFGLTGPQNIDEPDTLIDIAIDLYREASTSDMVKNAVFWKILTHTELVYDECTPVGSVYRRMIQTAVHDALLRTAAYRQVIEFGNTVRTVKTVPTMPTDEAYAKAEELGLTGFDKDVKLSAEENLKRAVAGVDLGPEDLVCPICHKRNTLYHGEGNAECHDCGKEFKVLQ